MQNASSLFFYHSNGNKVEVARENTGDWGQYWYVERKTPEYLQSRYYDPVVGRFINADGTVSTGQGLTGTNMYAYCGNNPICRADPAGRSFLAIGGITLLVMGIITLCTSSGAETPSTIETQEWDCNIVFNEPTEGEANSKREWYDDNGNLTKERWYGPDGRVTKDRHHTDHGHPKQHPYVPHDHDWGLNEDGKWSPGPAYPSPKSGSSQGFTHEQAAGALVATSAGVGIAYGIYSALKWAIAIALAGATGGGSLAVAGATP